MATRAFATVAPSRANARSRVELGLECANRVRARTVRCKLIVMDEMARHTTSFDAAAGNNTSAQTRRCPLGGEWPRDIRAEGGLIFDRRLARELDARQRWALVTGAGDANAECAQGAIFRVGGAVVVASLLADLDGAHGSPL